MIKKLPLGALCLVVGLTTAACAERDEQASPRLSVLQSSAEDAPLPTARWDDVAQSDLWTEASLSALQTHGQPLVSSVPADIDRWCPAYAAADDATRRAFWVGFLSALSKYESTYRAEAVGGGGKWFGLLQISPATARGYGCAAGSGEALKSGPANLSCAIRIMARTVPRDGVVHGRADGWQGVSADWGPMRDPAKRDSIANWVRQQDYCAL